MSEAPRTTDALRNAIDSGGTGEKIGFPDPATAPLGTDAEAGGHPPTKAEIATAAATAPRATRRNHDGGTWSGAKAYLLLAGAVTIAILVIIVWTQAAVAFL